MGTKPRRPIPPRVPHRPAIAAAPPILAVAGLALLAAAPAGAATPLDTDAGARCVAMVAYAEAAGEGAAGLAAVVQVIRNRVADPRFPDDACAVVRAPGEFQPVGDSPRLKAALANPIAADMVVALGDFGVDREILAEAARLARAEAVADPTGGALYFVNPDFMDPSKCPWFARLKRTAAVGGHVFMTHWAEGEAPSGPALDCSVAGRGFVALGGRPARARKTARRKVNPAWVVSVERSGLAEGRACRVGTYDAATRTYARTAGC